MQDLDGMGVSRRRVPLPKQLRYLDRAVLQLLAAGQTMEQAARQMGVTDRTVHRIIHERMGAKTAAQAVALGYEHGYLGGRRLMLVPVA